MQQCTAYGLYKYGIEKYVFKYLMNIGYHKILFPFNQAHFNTRNMINLTVPRCRTEKNSVLNMLAA